MRWKSAQKKDLKKKKEKKGRWMCEEAENALYSFYSFGRGFLMRGGADVGLSPQCQGTVEN